MFREAKEFFDAMQRDPVNRKVAEAWQNIADDLFEGEDRTRLSSKGLQAFENVFRHLLVTEFQYVPLPRIEFSDQDLSAILDDMVVKSAEILPDKVIFRASTTNQLARNDENKSENLLEVYMEQIRFVMEDFYFWFDRKTFPAITDEGRADLAVLDQGVKIHLILRFIASENRAKEAGKGPVHIEVKRATISIDNLRLKVREAKNHQILLKMMTPFVKGNIRTRMQQGLESSIRGLVDRLNMYLDSKNPDYMSNIVKQYLV
jgi:DNA ligase-4